MGSCWDLKGGGMQKKKWLSSGGQKIREKGAPREIF